MYRWLFGGLEHFLFSYILGIILGIIIPTDELIFFRGVGQPPTRWWFLTAQNKSASRSRGAKPRHQDIRRIWVSSRTIPNLYHLTSHHVTSRHVTSRHITSHHRQTDRQTDTHIHTDRQTYIHTYVSYLSLSLSLCIYIYMYNIYIYKIYMKCFWTSCDSCVDPCSSSMECNHRASALMKRTVFFLFFSHFYKSKLLNFQKKDKMLSVGDPRARFCPENVELGRFLWHLW